MNNLEKKGWFAGQRITFDAGWFSQQLLVTLAGSGSHQEKLKSLVKYSSSVENSKLRERLGGVEADTPVKVSTFVKASARSIKMGFTYVMIFMDSAEAGRRCMFCDELL